MNQDIQNLIFPFPIKQAVLWGEMDAWNHINNVIYFRYFETGRVEFFNKTNLWKLFTQNAFVNLQNAFTVAVPRNRPAAVKTGPGANRR